MESVLRGVCAREENKVGAKDGKGGVRGFPS